MAGYKLELLKLLGKIAKHTDCYKMKCHVFRLVCWCSDVAVHRFTKDCFQKLYLQLIARSKGESWSKPAQPDRFNKGRRAGKSNLQAMIPPLWWLWGLIAVTHSTDPRGGKRCLELGGLCSSFY